MMQKITLVISMLVFFVGVSKAQIVNPVTWNYSAKKIGEKTYELHFGAMIDRYWHLYAQDSGEEMLSTAFNFTANPLVKLDGKVKESGQLKNVYDPNLRSALKFYYEKVDFIQKVQVKSTATTFVKGSVTYVVCSDKDKKCLPAKEAAFSIKIGAK